MLKFLDMEKMIEMKPVKGRVRVLSPAWYRAAREFQSLPEEERLVFCSRCGCTGGCNLCHDISKYDVTQLKLYK